MKIEFRVILNSDYHIGTGAGDSAIDSFLFKDSDGELVIRGTTITGLLGQGLQELLMTEPLSDFPRCKRSGNPGGPAFCDNEDPCMICRILGTPANPKHWYFSTAIPEKPESAEYESSRIVMRTTVDMRTRCSEEDKLFSQEMGTKSASFVFTAECRTSSEEILKEAAFIVAGLRTVRSLGSFRRRGKGECLFEVKNTDLDISGDPTNWFIDRFKEAIEGQKLELSYNRSVPTLDGTPSQYMILLETREPLLISSNSGEGNVYRGLNYVPGQTLRGALASLVAQTNDLSDQNIYKTFVDCCVVGGVRVTNCYPAMPIDTGHGDTQDGELRYAAMVPVPANWLFCELERDHPFQRLEDFQDSGSSGNAERELVCPICVEDKSTETKSKLKQRQGFVASTGEVYDIEADQEEAHIRMDYLKGIVERGALFKYSCLPKGNQFVGIIRIKDEQVSNFNGLLESCTDSVSDDGTIVLRLRIGKGRTRGYGLTNVRLKPIDGLGRLLVFHHKSDKEIEETAPITMLFLSDAILVDTFGRYIQHFDDEIMTDLIGAKARVRLQSIRTKRIKGFNSFLGLPRWTELAIAAGSVIQFDVDDQWEVVHKQLLELQDQGVGIRKDEGFGMVSFNHPILKLDALSWVEYSHTSRANESLRDQVETWLRDAERILSSIARRFDSKSASKGRALVRLLWTRRFDDGITEEIDCGMNRERAGLVDAVGSMRRQKPRSESKADNTSKDYIKFETELRAQAEKLDVIISQFDEMTRARLRGRALERLLEYLQTCLEEAENV